MKKTYKIFTLDLTNYTLQDVNNEGYDTEEEAIKRLELLTSEFSDYYAIIPIYSI